MMWKSLLLPVRSVPDPSPPISPPPGTSSPCQYPGATPGTDSGTLPPTSSSEWPPPNSTHASFGPGPWAPVHQHTLHQWSDGWWRCPNVELHECCWC
ncbi:zyxin-like [Nothobranchius furzeri]|uniref:zyxin-like n=1 Tax=Nothobranchius furzeri TaxID=105023 RepID=UPI00390492C4